MLTESADADEDVAEDVASESVVWWEADAAAAEKPVAEECAAAGERGEGLSLYMADAMLRGVRP